MGAPSVDRLYHAGGGLATAQGSRLTLFPRLWFNSAPCREPSNKADVSIMSTVYLGLGANLGDRLANLRHARAALAASEGLRLQAGSHYYETEPVGGPEGQPTFFNAVLRFEAELTPHEILLRAQELERACGRKRAERWGPRTLDIDLLLFDDLVSCDPQLELPHPRMAKRGFVLAPLAELAPELLIPGVAATVAELWTPMSAQAGIVCRGEW